MSKRTFEERRSVLEAEKILLICAEHIFDAIDDEAYRGYVLIKGDKIAEVGRGTAPEELMAGADRIIRFTDELVMPGITDTHTFFIGWAIRHAGRDEETDYSDEGIARLMKTYIDQKAFMEKELADYCRMLNAQGVTTVKEMGFDDYYGFTDILKEKENDSSFTLRWFFMSQPVLKGMNLEYARNMREQFTGDKVRFSGFNRMTDGTIASGRGDLKKPYEKEKFTCSMDIDYETIERDVLLADREGFRWSLHCQGDGAVGKVASIYEKCEMEDGRLKNRQALTDMEFSDPTDLERLGAIGASAELYFQIMSLDPGEVVLENIERTIGPERALFYWNRRKMKDSGMNLCGATDLPLMIPDVPASIYYSAGGHLEGGALFNEQNTLTAAEILKAWTRGGAYDLGMEDRIGTLKAGNYADIAVFDRDLTAPAQTDSKEAKVIMTVLNGEIVYEG
ncbi:MAG TPA: amidohydrolase [Lachnospiraceae bacterium]|nr:amidohydrolase [Lachnospiraceae bacterium]